MTRIALAASPGTAIAPGLFGQFLERVGWCPELGPEAAMDAGGWKPEALAALRAAQVTSLRFPGGNDVDRTDWRDLVDGAHGPGPRPALQVVPHTTVRHERTTRCGYDEFARLAEDLRADSVVVLNLGDALLKRRTPEASAANAAGLVAYLTAPLGAKLPAGMPDWPALRAANGHPEPYRIGWIQLGNETWWPHKAAKVQEAIGSTDRDTYLAWYLTCLRTLIAAVRAVNPTIPLIMDGLCGLGTEAEVLRQDDVRRELAAVAHHSYSPWVFSELRWGTTPFGGATLPVDAIDTDTWWKLLVSCPGHCDAQGRNVGWTDAELALYEELGLKLAITEWNWNGFNDGKGVPAMDLIHASMVGTANFLHGLLRRADRIVVGNQSMLMGTHWDITGLRLDPTGARAPFRVPQFAVTTAFRQLTGTHLLDVATSGGAGYAQPYATGNMMARAQAHVAWIDALATADGARSIISLVNRRRHEAERITIDPGPRHAGASRVRVRRLHCLPEGERPERLDAVRLIDDGERSTQGSFTLDVPAAAVAFVEIAPA